MNETTAAAWRKLNRRIVDCERCPRLLSHCREVARTRRRSFSDWEYWGRPVPNFGDPAARLMIVGLAPAAHGANRTGRMFTGDRSGDWLYRALHKAGFANQQRSTDCNDGLILKDCCITAVCHCAPPANKPTREEMMHCAAWLNDTVSLVPARVFLALGQIAWRSLIGWARSANRYEGPIPKFGHGLRVELKSRQWLVGSYHPGQQNTFTGKLTEPMLDSVFETCRSLLAGGSQ